MNYFTVAQTLLAIILVITILLQGRGAGLGSSWGGDGETYGTRRGVEKLLFRVTIVSAICFVLVSLASLIL
jgi:preprotein translocase subunit SecG